MLTRAPQMGHGGFPFWDRARTAKNLIDKINVACSVRGRRLSVAGMRS